jgi:hypothetical protein
MNINYNQNMTEWVPMLELSGLQQNITSSNWVRD